MRVLLERGADVNASGALGQRPLHCAGYVGFVGGIEALLEHGADACARDSHGRLPHEFAATGGSSAHTVALLERSCARQLTARVALGLAAQRLPVLCVVSVLEWLSGARLAPTSEWALLQTVHRKCEKTLLQQT